MSLKSIIIRWDLYFGKDSFQLILFFKKIKMDTAVFLTAIRISRISSYLSKKTSAFHFLLPVATFLLILS